MNDIRKIIHIDMDAFFAAVEQRDHPELRGKCVIVGGAPSTRGVVATCSYEARRYGIRSAMSCREAYKRCPDAHFIEPHFDLYKAISKQIHDIFYMYTDIVEPVSLDEAYLDVTSNKINSPYATPLAEEIRQKIYRETGLTASAGISFNKFLAKIASEWNKPDGLTVIAPGSERYFIDVLPIRKFHGIGKVTAEKMASLGIHTGADLKTFSRENLLHFFGKMGGYYYSISHGHDERRVEPHQERKSIGRETTFEYDTNDPLIINDVLRSLASSVETILKKHKKHAKTVTLKIRYHDFSTVTRSISIKNALTQADEIMPLIDHLLRKTEVQMKKVRLLGITLSNFTDLSEKIASQQLEFPFS